MKRQPIQPRRQNQVRDEENRCCWQRWPPCIQLNPGLTSYVSQRIRVFAKVGWVIYPSQEKNPELVTYSLDVYSMGSFHFFRSPIPHCCQGRVSGTSRSCSCVYYLVSSFLFSVINPTQELLPHTVMLPNLELHFSGCKHMHFSASLPGSLTLRSTTQCKYMSKAGTLSITLFQ